MQIASFIFC